MNKNCSRVCCLRCVAVLVCSVVEWMNAFITKKKQRRQHNFYVLQYCTHKNSIIIPKIISLFRKMKPIAFAIPVDYYCIFVEHFKKIRYRHWSMLPLTMYVVQLVSIFGAVRGRHNCLAHGKEGWRRKERRIHTLELSTVLQKDYSSINK